MGKCKYCYIYEHVNLKSINKLLLHNWGKEQIRLVKIEEENNQIRKDKRTSMMSK